MPNKIIQKSHINRLTENGEYKYPWHSKTIGDATFTKSFNTCYFNGLTFEKIKGGGKFGGNYLCVEQNDEYRISSY